MQNVSKLCTEISSSNDTSYLDIVERDITDMKVYIQVSFFPMTIKLNLLLKELDVLFYPTTNRFV